MTESTVSPSSVEDSTDLKISSEGPVIAEHFSDFDLKYERKKQLGRAGQYGVTFLCSSKKTKSGSSRKTKNGVVIPDEVAIKIMNKSRFKKSGARLYQKWIGFQKSEITALILSSHERIVQLYEVLEDENYVYLVMEYLRGGELLHWIVNQKGTISEFTVANVILQILEALDYLHNRNIIHLDMKPENIMLACDPYDDMPKVKLIDFGFANILPRLEKMDGKRGTLFYMPPEMVDNANQYDRAADVWATGVITFTMLFGFLPFFDDLGRSERVIVNEILMGFRPEVMRGCGPWFPKSIPISDEGMHVISRMLTSNVRDRITVEEALSTPWIRGHAPKDPLPEIVMRGLTQFTKAFHHNKKMTLLISDPEIVRLSEVGNSDERTDSIMEEYADENGLIEKDSFVRRMGSKMTGMRYAAIDQIFDEVDTDQDGYITIETMKRIEAFHALVAVDDRIFKLFDELDENGDGVLSPQEIEHAIEKISSPEVRQLVHMRSILAVTDLNNDGVIDRDEFLRAIHPNYLGDDFGEETLSVKRSQAFSFPSIRQRTQLYFELLRQLEEQESVSHSGAVSSGLSVPVGYSRQLTVPEAMRTPTPIGGTQDEKDTSSDVNIPPAEMRRRQIQEKLRREMDRKSQGDIIIALGDPDDMTRGETVVTIDLSGGSKIKVKNDQEKPRNKGSEEEHESQDAVVTQKAQPRQEDGIQAIPSSSSHATQPSREEDDDERVDVPSQTAGCCTVM